jgi:hypothetical protein
MGVVFWGRGYWKFCRVIKGCGWSLEKRNNTLMYLRGVVFQKEISCKGGWSFPGRGWVLVNV